MNKKRVLSIVLSAIILLCSANVAKASGNTGEGYSDLIGLSGFNYSTEGKEVMDPQYDITELLIPVEFVMLSNETSTEFVDAIAKTKTGEYVNVSEWCVWTVTDENVARCDRGRVDALGRGKCTLSVSYNGLSYEIPIYVQNVKDNTSAESNMVSRNVNYPMLRALETLNYSWTPTSNLTGWKGNYIYKAGTKVTGIPYSQTEYQAYAKTYSGFATRQFSTSLSGFYDSYTRSGVVMPKYGLDCSAFLSYCWGTSRKTTAIFRSGLYNGSSLYSVVGSYNPKDYISSSYSMLSLTSAKKETLKTAYASLQTNHGLVNGGHCMYVRSNDASTKKVVVIEQTLYVTRMTTYTYDSLANSGYLPFKFN